MPTQLQPPDLLRALIRQWAGTGPADRAWTRDEVAQVWPLLLEQHVEVSLGAALPADLLSDAQRAAVAASRERTACLLLELERILPAVRAAGCEPVVLKGAALALTAYADPLERWFVDLDLLVPRDVVETVCGRLLATGYHPLRGRGAWAYYDRHHVHRILVGPAGSVVEVHWALTVPASAYHYDPQGVRDRAQPVAVGRGTCLAASPADQVVHAVYQHLANGFVDLRRALDLARLAPRMTPLDWRDAATVAEAADLDRGLEYWLHVMKQLTGVALPDLERPRRPLGPLAWRLLGNLDVAGGCLERRAARVPVYDQFLHQVLLPSTARRFRDLGRIALSSGAYGIITDRPDGPIMSWPRRLRLGAWRLRQMARIALAAAGARPLKSS